MSGGQPASGPPLGPRVAPPFGGRLGALGALGAPERTRPRRGRRPLARLCIAGVVAAGVLAACGLPSQGPVQRGLEIGAAPLPPVRFEFAAPRDGAGPEEIVRGFLAASWSGQDDYRAARAYLTAGASAAWDPRSSVTVYPSSSQLHVESLAADRIRLRTGVAAQVDRGGRYASQPFGSTRSSVVELSHASGQWRISRLDSGFGVWLSRSYFESAFRPFQIAYVGATERTVVSDRRWFPVGGSSLATTLARALVEPVPDYLRGAATSGFPPSTRLALDAVPVVGERAQIDLDPGVLGGTSEQRRAAWAQALVTLRQVPGVSAVSLRAQGRELDIVGDESTPTSPEALGYTTSVDPSPYVVRRSGSSLTLVDSDAVGAGNAASRASGRRLPEVAAGWARIAVSADAAEVAAVGGDGLDLKRWRGERSAQLPRFATALTPPAFDRHGALWVGGRDAKGLATVYVLPPGAADAGLAASPRALSTPWLGRSGIVEVRPSPDGQRAVVLSRSPSGRVQIGVSGVVRGEDGLPRALTAPWPVGGDVVDAHRVAWVSGGTLAVLGRRDTGGSVRPLLVEVGGATTPLAAIADPRSLVAVGGTRGLLVVSGGGTVSARAGAGWQSVGRIDDLVVPGG